MTPVRQIMVVGAGGMLGTALQRAARIGGLTVRAYSEADLDITDRAAISSAIGAFAAQVSRAGVGGAVINAAAYTNVEAAEGDPDRAYLVNSTAAGWLATAASDEGLAFVHVSTDFVFDGTKVGAYLETDEPRPLSVYGTSKLAGEKAVLATDPSPLVIRTAWAFGPAGANFPVKILERAQAATSGAADTATATVSGDVRVLQVVADEVGSPTYTLDLAGGMLALVAAGATGLFHLTGTGSCSRYELALETLRLAGFAVPGDLRVEPVASATFPTKAERPLNSVLDCGKAERLGVRLPAWQDGLSRFVTELRE
jgi:dTDP-4-dehydrorhamnose reductase